MPTPAQEKQKTYSPIWEIIAPYCKRMAVPGGWIVYVWDADNTNGAVCFVPDSASEWVLKTV